MYLISLNYVRGKNEPEEASTMEPIAFRIGHLVEIYTHDIVLRSQVRALATKRAHFERTPDTQVNPDVFPEVLVRIASRHVPTLAFNMSKNILEVVSISKRHQFWISFLFLSATHLSISLPKSFILSSAGDTAIYSE